MHRLAKRYPMGDIGEARTSDEDATKELRRQVNRFGPEAPPAYRFVDGSYKSAYFDPLDDKLALIAVTIYQRAATDSYNKFHDAGSANAVTSANSGFANPMAWVAPNMASIARYIEAYADSIGLAPASGSDPTTSTKVLYVVLGGVLLTAIGMIVFAHTSSRSPERDRKYLESL